MKVKKWYRKKVVANKKVNFFLKLAMVVLFVLGSLVFMYPFVVDALNNYLDQQRINEFHTKIVTSNQEKLAKRKQQLLKENLKNSQSQEIPGMGLVADPFQDVAANEREPDLSYFQEMTIGAVYIPKIKVSLPVFKETNDKLLSKGATVLQGTSFPIGGAGTHGVITGHTGLPDKKLFTDLEDLEKKDHFYLEILGEQLAYEVFKIQKVLPEELDGIQKQPEEDLVTLLTCTPYMVNTHRLLVTGRRIPYPAAMKAEIQQARDYHKSRLWWLVAFLTLLLGGVLWFTWRLIILYRSRKRHYHLPVRIIFGERPVAGVPIQLLDRRGQPLSPPQRGLTDRHGKIDFQQIPGDKYRLQIAGEKTRRRVAVKRLSKELLQLRGPATLLVKGETAYYQVQLAKGGQKA